MYLNFKVLTICCAVLCICLTTSLIRSYQLAGLLREQNYFVERQDKMIDGLQKQIRKSLIQTDACLTIIRDLKKLD